LFDTKVLIKELGGQVHYVEGKYIADVYIARTKLLGIFYRNPQYTHILFIDDDMGWNAWDVIRMLLLEREFLCAIGPKKKYPIEFAFSLHDDYSRPIPLIHEVETNVAEISEAGGAFVLLKRSCVGRMWQAYPELEFDGDENTTDVALFDPIIINKGREWPRRRLSEDYAFCYRWRKLGGKVNVLLDVELSHTGSHTFKASLYDYLVQQTPDFSAPPDERLVSEDESYT
jgi:hypothetical protein